jgi:sarcosine oxidase
LNNHYQTIVIGVGSMGAAACYYLVRRGNRVLGIEQFDLPNDRGSHAGQSRIIRKAYFEHPDYVPLLQRSYDNWRAFENEVSNRYYFDTGVVYFGTNDNPTMVGVRKSAELYHVPIHNYDIKEQRKRWPMFRLPDNFEAILEPDAGFVTPERTISGFAAEAEKLGATILRRTAVRSWKYERGRVRVITDKGEFTAEKLVISAGAWTANLLPQLQRRLRVTRQMLAWVMPRNTAQLSPEKFPCWFVEDPDLGSFYGFPVVHDSISPGPVGLKLAHHYDGEPSRPDEVDGPVPEAEIEKLRNFLRTYMPDVGEDIIATRKCLYTNSPDEDFIIDLLPGHDGRVTIACGFSGHGFKFVPAVGEILADLATNGKTDLPIDFLSLKRFDG